MKNSGSMDPMVIIAELRTALTEDTIKQRIALQQERNKNKSMEARLVSEYAPNSSISTIVSHNSNRFFFVGCVGRDGKTALVAVLIKKRLRSYSTAANVYRN